MPLSTFAPGPELGRLLQHATWLPSTAPSFLESIMFWLEVALEGLAIRAGTCPWTRRHIPVDPPRRCQSDRVGPVSSVATQRAVVRRGAPGRPQPTHRRRSIPSGPPLDRSVVHTHGSLIRHSALMCRSGHEVPLIACAARRLLLGGRPYYGPPVRPDLRSRAVRPTRFEPAEALDLVERERATYPGVAACGTGNGKALTASTSQIDERTWRNRPRSIAKTVAAENRLISTRPLRHDRSGGPLPIPTSVTPTSPDSLEGNVPERVFRGSSGKVVDPDSMRSLGAGNVGELLCVGPSPDGTDVQERRHETFDRDGWYATGDLCSLDDEGFLRPDGRKTPMIKTGGSNVAPREVEEALTAFPAVKTAYVLGVPAAARGEEVVAVVVPTEGYLPDGQELTDYLRTRLSTYKIPRRWLIVDERSLPLLPAGKVDVQALRGLFAA